MSKPKIEQMLIPKSNKYTRPGTRLNPVGVTIHETANTNKGAGADAHARLQYNGNSRQASWHYQVDSKRIIQSIPDNEVAYAAGSKSNNSHIQIEICVNSDDNYTLAVRNAQYLVNLLIDKYAGIKKGNVVQHNYWTGKDCPHFMRSGNRGITWSTFISGISAIGIPPSQYEGNKPISGVVVGDYVRVLPLVSRYATGELVPNWVKGQTYKVTRVEPTRILVDKINSWFKLQDLEHNPPTGVGNTNVPQPKPPVTTVSTPVLRFGDSGTAVTQLQRDLVKVYFYPNKNKANKGVDGMFGRETQDAVKRFQSVYTPKEVDGIFGPKTRKALAEQVAKA